MIRIIESEDGWMNLDVNGTRNYIEFDEQGNITLVENKKTTLDVDQKEYLDEILTDIEGTKGNLVQAMDKLNKYI